MKPKPDKPLMESLYNSSPQAILKKRTLSFAVDLFFLAILNRLIMAGYTQYVMTYFYKLPWQTQEVLVHKMPQIGFTIYLVTFWAYFLTSYFLTHGQTPGKMIFGLKIKPNHHQGPVTLKECAMRTLGYFTCYMTGFFLFVIPLLRKDAKGLPDWFSDTSVASAKEEAQPLRLEDRTHPVIELPYKQKNSDNDDQAA